ncbi:glycoside hydrolase family 32 protein [Yeosuana marina]|uniref:glycoside hydrolase family 32 protein n=1 Tax=Yeosuana marina TaxID=1565536 RepID=UPI0030C7DAAB
MRYNTYFLKLTWATILGCHMGLQGFGQQKDNESLVPKLDYPSTLLEQEEMLALDPLLIRFKASRRKLKKDRYYPIYHFVSPENRLNDPNGLCFWQGRWHLFYQGYPPEDSRQHWGHAVSNDLVHWKDLPYAIYPGPEYASFSGSTWVENNRVIAMYHGTTLGNMIAIADDPLLLNWKKLSSNPVIPMEDASNLSQPYKVFDPFIWKKGDFYYSLSGSKSSNGPEGKPVRAHYLFRSKDVLNWEYMHEFVVGDRFTKIGDDGACPYFWPIGDRYILLFFSHLSGAQYFLGDYDKQGDLFNITAHGRFNFGTSRPSGIHAPSAFSDGKGGVIAIFNINKGKSTKGWDQMMSLPRQLSLTAEDELEMQPIEAIKSLRKDEVNIEHLVLPKDKEIILNAVQGNAIEIVAEINLRASKMLEINILRSPHKEEYTKISFFKEKGDYKGLEFANGTEKAAQYKRARYSLISLETTYASNASDVNYRVPETAPVLVDSDENLELRIFIDKSVVEVFVNNKQCVAARVYPNREDSIGVSFKAQGSESELISLKAYQMKDIYETP